jgi:hypothetical protein
MRSFVLAVSNDIILHKCLSLRELEWFSLRGNRHCSLSSTSQSRKDARLSSDELDSPRYGICRGLKTGTGDWLRLAYSYL